MKIGITGSHSTGKTTALSKAKSILESKGLRVGYVGDVARECPLPILREHTVHSTLWIVTHTIAKEIQSEYVNDVVLVDRPITDAVAYYWAAMAYRGEKWNPCNAEDKTLISLIKNWTQTYDIIFRTTIDPDIAIEDDGSRDIDPLFRLQTAQSLESVVSYFEQDMLLLSGDRDAKAEFITRTIESNFRKKPGKEAPSSGSGC